MAIIGFNASARDVLLSLLPHREKIKEIALSGLG